MKRVSRYTLIFTMFFVLVASLFAYNPGNVKAEEDTLGLKAEAAMILDAKSGKILYEKNADKVLGIASMSKMMTEYMVLEAIDEGKITWDQTVKINNYVHRLSKAPNLSNVGLTEGEDYTVKELYEAMAVHSGNAATVALAELLGGSEKNYVMLMTKKAKELGLKNFKFVNSSGLNNKDLLGNHPAGSANEENVMTAHDMGLLAFRILTDYPEVLETAKIPKLKFRDGKEYANFNWMLPGLIHGYPGVDGLKTGSTDFAGYAHTGTVEKDGQRYITIVMKSTSKDERFGDTKKLMDYAFATFDKEKVLSAGYKPKDKKTLPVVKGKEDKVEIETKEAIELVTKRDEKGNYQPQVVLNKEKLNKDGELLAPVKKGEKIGYVTVKPKKGQEYGFITREGNNSITVDLVAAEKVEKANWFVLSMRAVGGFFGDVWNGAASTIKGWF
ncbi:serine hydrolase [Peribacillus glennii]|uniref:serine-type D-Ala-D-Ala carboxypeptidase n=1 Tax=Peribacillus glennii TaxID=2303991 RepID=A0A372L831_9BACI|nr:serine hydrolase [Peribacillus glennii]RFU61465.1 D-alanyl-D-alanine carboxypeptidase [Peribacillus glennii]